MAGVGFALFEVSFLFFFFVRTSQGKVRGSLLGNAFFLSYLSSSFFLCFADIREAFFFVLFAGAGAGVARTVHGGHLRMMSTYYLPYKGYFFTGDGVFRDSEGYYWITGRVDDTLNVSGKDRSWTGARRRKKNERKQGRRKDRKVREGETMYTREHAWGTDR